MAASWHTLPLGAGGLVSGISIASDGAMVCRTDVGNIYRWTGKTTDYANTAAVWQPLMTFASLGSSATVAASGNDFGGWEHVLAPSNSSVHLAIFTDMTDVAGKSWIWYSINQGATWNQTNIFFLHESAASNAGGGDSGVSPSGGDSRRAYYKIAIDPANPNIAYCGIPVVGFRAVSSWTTSSSTITMLDSNLPSWLVGLVIYDTNISATIGTVQSVSGNVITLTANATHASSGSSDGLTFVASSGNSAGAYTTLNTGGGSTLATWVSVKTSGSTPIPATLIGTSAGLVIDPSLGTTTISGQTVTKHIYLPVGGVGIYESVDGGQNFTEIAVSAFGASNFWITNAGCNVNGVYYAVVIFQTSPTSNSLWRYVPTGVAGGGTWTNITPPSYTGGNAPPAGTTIIIDSRSGSSNYLSITGPQGIGCGFTSTVASTASSSTINWNGLTGGENTRLQAADYDIPYLNFIFGQGANFTDAACTVVDPNGTLWFGGNQSLWYYGSSSSSTLPSTSLISYTAGINNFFWSMGRGQEATVGIDMLRPPGGPFVIEGPQDIGAPLRGTYGTYPKDLGIHNQEYQCPSIEYAASDPRFVVACVTYQSQQGGGSHYVYSTNYGADGTWIEPATMPDGIWNPAITASISIVSGVLILNVTALTPSNGIITPTTGFVFQNFNTTGNFYGVIQAYGTSGTTGTGGTGTYALGSISPISPPSAPTLTPSGSGGSLATGTVFVEITYVNSSGETVASAEASTPVTGPTASVTVASPSAAGGGYPPAATGYNVYSSSTTGTEKLNSGGPISIGTNFTITSLGAGASPPTTNTTGNLASLSAFVVQPFEAGQVVAVDHNTWLACPQGNGAHFIPAFTNNATGVISWAPVSGLPAASWFSAPQFPWSFASTAKAFCVGYGPDLGCVWAVLFTATTTATLYRCPDLRSGSTFTAIATFTVSASNVSPFIYSVPNVPNELWVSAKFSGGSPAELWHVTSANSSAATVTPIATPAANPNPIAFSLGAPAQAGGYPTIYYLGNTGFGTPKTIYQGTYTSGSTSVLWSTFGPTGTNADLPPVGQVPGVSFIRADLDVYQRLYATVGQSGFAFFGDLSTPLPIPSTIFHLINIS